MPRPDAESYGPEIGVPADKRTRWLIAIAAMASAVMELVDTSAVNVSLPYAVSRKDPAEGMPPSDT